MFRLSFILCKQNLTFNINLPALRPSVIIACCCLFCRVSAPNTIRPKAMSSRMVSLQVFLSLRVPAVHIIQVADDRLFLICDLRCSAEIFPT